MADFNDTRTQNLTIAIVSLFCLVMLGTCVAGAMCLAGAFRGEQKECAEP